MTESTFSDFKLLKSLQKAVAAEQYRTPTPIQAAAIPKILDGRDILGTAQTGTGKTAAFALPILNRIAKDRRSLAPHTPRVLVLSPTRELASQISERFLAYGKQMHLRLVTIFGGVGQNPQVRALKRGVHIMVATPGRLVDLINQGHVELDRLDVFVLDEADRMLDMGFLPDLKKIIVELPEKRQSLFFSATMPARAVELADKLLKKPVRIDVTPDDAATSTTDLVDQKVLFVEPKKKLSLLSHLLKRKQYGSVLVFTRTKHGADRLSKELRKRDFDSEAIHGNRTQSARTRILTDFRKGKFQILVATDVAARGIDVDGISHVVNYDIPNEPDAYVHRIGRTGRAGATGVALTFCPADDLGQWRAIERHIKQKIEVDPEHPYHVPGLEELNPPVKPGPPGGGRSRNPRSRGGGPPRRQSGNRRRSRSSGGRSS